MVENLSTALAKAPHQVEIVHSWEDDFRPLLTQQHGRVAALERIAEERGVPYPTVRTKFYAYQKGGAGALINRQGHNLRCGMSVGDRELIKLWCGLFQRSSEAGLRALRRAWLTQSVPDELRRRGVAVPETDTPVNPLTGYPRGWDLRNLMRYAPTTFELKAVRIGRAAAASHRPLVYTTRANLYVGQYYLFDDMWHDHVVNNLDTRKSGRPLEFHGLDLASACKIAWGMRVREQTGDVQGGLQGGDFRFLLAALLCGDGYHPNGTTLVVEHGTAAISERIERLLFDATSGAIIVGRSGMTGAAAHAGQYAGRAKGNFRFKAALESLGNLIHNELAALPGQVGKDRDHSPEQMHDGGRLVDPRTGLALSRQGLMKHNDALLAALAQLPPERAQWLQWDICSIAQFRLIAEEVYARINDRKDHDLEGWDTRYVPDPRSGGMRRMSPREVWTPGKRALRGLSPETAALILGHEDGVERLTRNHLIELRDSEVSGDVLRFDASALPDREKYLTVLNPFDPKQLTCFDARGRYVATLARLHSVCRSDAEAVQREMGRAAKTEAALLQPIRQRHLGEAREKLARHEHNTRVLRGEPISPEEHAAADLQRERAVGIDSFRSERTPEAETAEAGDFAAPPANPAPTPFAGADDFL